MDNITLLEYFAAHAPERPAWWNTAAPHEESKLSDEERFKRFIAWRWAYAEAMSLFWRTRGNGML